MDSLLGWSQGKRSLFSVPLSYRLIQIQKYIAKKFNFISYSDPFIAYSLLYLNPGRGAPSGGYGTVPGYSQNDSNV